MTPKQKLNAPPRPATVRPPRREPAIRMIAMPADANPSGDIFGGWIMSLMDMAGGQVAFQFAGGRIVTVAVDEIVFHVPVGVGEEVSCYAEVVRTGRTSVRTHVEVWTRRRAGGPRFRVTEGDYTYVLVDREGRPKPLAEQLQRRGLGAGGNTKGTLGRK